MAEYIPHPADTTDIELSPELTSLAEVLAQHVHEVWSTRRISDGWTYGPNRDDILKHHPGLVPYDQLTEIEKDYDRNTSQQTLKLILKLGFKITK